ncbi:MAG: YraN family protein [Flavobacteriaceae bacterium]|jgi:putative endonuclease
MNTTKLGRQGESLAAESYQKKGYTILKRNYRFGRSEVDIIARKGEILAIVEVKSRTSTYFGDPQSFVSKKQQRSLIVAADHFVSTNNLDVNVRFDIVSIVSQGKNIKLQIIENAFYPF